MIASMLTATGMAIDILIKVLLLGSGEAQGKSGGKPENVKEWQRNKLKALALLLGRLRMKVAEGLPGIIGAIKRWILKRMKEVAGCILQYLWALVIVVGGLLYTYMLMRK